MSRVQGDGPTWGSAEERRADAQREFHSVMTTPGPSQPTHAYYEAGVIGFVFGEIMLTPAPAAATTFRQLGYFAYLYGEIWTRPNLTRRERRIISICAAAAAKCERELEMHLFAALASGDLSFEELQEIVLHYAV